MPGHINIQPYELDEYDTDHYSIYVWGLDVNSKSNLIRIENFTPFIYVELSQYVGGRRFAWNPQLASLFFRYMKDILRHDAPINYTYRPSRDLYYFQGDNKKPYIMLIFKTLSAQRHCKAILNKEIFFRVGNQVFGTMKANVCEDDISSIRKMLTARGMEYSGWWKITGKHPLPRPAAMGLDEGRVISEEITKDARGNRVYLDTADSYFAVSTLPLEREWIVDWKDLSTSDPEEVKGILTTPKLASFDLECYSHNVRVFPNMLNDLDVTIMNSVVIQVSGKPETVHRYGIVKGDVNDIPDEVLKGVKVIRVKEQLDIVRVFARLVNEHDVDVFTGYNINDFDFLWLDAKLQAELEPWPQFGRLVNQPTELKSWDWESGGYGFNSINILKAAGRIPIDMYPVIKRDWKLIKYNLDTVAEKFLGRKKNDVTPAEMFISYDRARESMDKFDTAKTRISPEIPNSNDWLFESQGLPNEEEWKYANEKLTDGEDEYKEAVSGCLFKEDTIKEFGRIISKHIKDTDKCLNDYVKSIDNEESYIRWKAQKIANMRTKKSRIPGLNAVEVDVDESKIIFDNFNDPRKGGMYTRFGKINWCSDEFYVALLDVAVQSIQQGEPLRKEWKSLTCEILADYIIGTFLMTRVLLYCMVDSDIAIELFDKLNTWVGLIQMSKVAGVSVLDIFTRGQQIRCLSRLYDVAAKRGVILSKRASPDIFFNGGFVFHPTPGLYDAVIVVDFNSLYPSIMKQFNIDHTTLLAPEHFNIFPPEMVHTIAVPRPDKKAKDGASYDTEQPNRDEETEEDQEKAFVVSEIKRNMANVVSDENNYYIRFVKKEVLEGLFPAIVRDLVDERKRVRNEQKAFEEGSIGWLICEKLQLALKTVANSTFGFMGAGKMGKRSLIEGSMSITATGRMLIQHVNKYCEDKYNAVVRYGDSVTADTPILCKRGEDIFYEKICNLEANWVSVRGKEISDPEHDLKVWSDQGFTRIRKIIRHKCHKKIYKVRTNTGSVKVTEDHSLLDPLGKEVRPNEVRVGSELLSVDLPPLTNHQILEMMYGSDGDDDLSLARTFHMYSSLGYDLTLDDKLGVKMETPDTDSTIVSIKSLGYTDEYVYDLETENHHFAAGIGRLVVHNTDSSMIDMHLTDPKQYNPIGRALAKELSDLFGDELNLEMEKVLKAIFIKPKFYLSYVYDEDGNFKIDKKLGLPFLYTRGVILSRRDYPPYARMIYEKIARDLLDEKPIFDVLKDIIDAVKKLLRGEVDYNDLIIVKGISASYKSDTFYMKMFADRMSSLGTPLKPGERVGFLVHVPRNAIEEKYMGMRMTLPNLLEESKFSGNPMVIDYMYYLTKQMTNNVDILFYAGTNRSLGKYDIIKVRRTSRCKYVSLLKPMKFIGSMLEGGYSIDDLDLIINDIKAIDEGRYHDVVLKEGYDRPIEPKKVICIGKEAPLDLEKLRLAAAQELEKKNEVHVFN